MRPALEILLKKSLNRDYRSLEELAKGAVKDFIEKVKTSEKEFSKEVREKVESKLNKIIIISGPIVENITEKNLEESYKELNLNGTESFVQSALEILNFHQKVENDKRNQYKADSIFALDWHAQQQYIIYYPDFDKLSTKALLIL